jgi:hypothetical protein
MKENQQVEWIECCSIQSLEYDFWMAGFMLTFQVNPANIRTTFLDWGSTTPIATPNTIPITTRDKVVSLIQTKSYILAWEAQ